MTQLRAILVMLLLGLAAAASSAAAEPAGDEQVLEDLTKLADVQRYIDAHPASGAIDAARYEIAMLRARVLDPAVDRPQRAALLAQLLGRRDRLIGEYPKDPGRAVWLADQAADLYFLDWPTDGAGLTALFGLPSTEQRAGSRRIAAQMYAAASESDLLIGDAILAMEAAPDYATSAALQAQRRRLDETQRQRRIPFLHGIGACLAAELNADDETQRHHLYVTAAGLLKPLAAELEGPLAVQTRIYCGLALARLGEFDAAENMFRSAAAGDSGADPEDLFAARMTAVTNRTIRGGVDAGIEALESVDKRYAAAGADHGDLFFRVLLADARFALDRRRAMAAVEESARTALLVESFKRYVSSLNALRAPEHTPAAASGLSGLPGPPRVPAPAPGAAVRSASSIRSIVLAKLVAVLDEQSPSLPLQDLPALVGVAVASRLSADEATAPKAIELLERVLARGDLDEPDRAAALLALGRAYWSAGQPMPAMQRYAQLARDHPTDGEAERAIELAVTIAAGEYARAPGDAMIRSELDKALALLLDRYPNLPDIDRWRLLGGELALAEEQLDTAARLLTQIPPSAATWLDAQVLLARLTLMRCQSAVEPMARRRCLDGALSQIDQVRSLVKGLPDRPSDDLVAGVHSQLGQLRVVEARALIELGQPLKAVDALGDMDADPMLNQQLRGEALRVRLTAFQAADRPDDVLRDLRRYLESSSGGASEEPGQTETVLTSLLTTLVAEVQALVDDSRPEEALARAQRELEPMAVIIDSWCDGSTTPVRGHLRLRQLVADSFRLSEDWDKALQRYQRLRELEPGAAELLLGEAECLFMAGGGQAPRGGPVDSDRLGQAMIIYKRLAAIGNPPGNQFFWTAQLRMLQILDATGRNTRQIVPQIKRLRTLDAGLGGDRFRQKFDALQNTWAARD